MLSRTGLEVMCRVLAPGGEVVRIRRLGGGLAGETYAVHLRDRDDSLRKLVLKRCASQGVTIEREWLGLQVARSLQIPSPEPVALDTDGAWFGTPALVMSLAPGRPDVTGVKAAARLEQLARVLACLHQAPQPAGIPEAIPLQPRYIWATPKRPTRSPVLRSAYRLIEGSSAGEIQPDLVHGDMHPGNLLWMRGRLTGLVDWAGFGLGPRAFDVAHCRAELVLLFGSRIADSLLAQYVSQSERPLHDLPLWDLYCGLIALEHFPSWLVAYREQGVPDLKASHIRARLMAFIGRTVINVASSARHWSVKAGA